MGTLERKGSHHTPAAQMSKPLPLPLPAPALHALLLTTIFPTGGQGFWC